MARIAGVDIPKDKKVAYSLRYVHGIGLKTALDICEQAKVDPNIRVTDLTSKQEDEIRKVIVDLKLLIEGELRSEEIRFFLGYSGWDVDQLDNEIDSDSWIIDELDNSLFDWDVVKLWKKCLYEKGQKYKLWLNAPEDILLN